MKKVKYKSKKEESPVVSAALRDRILSWTADKFKGLNYENEKTN